MRLSNPKSYGVIYVFTNAVDGKKYVGQTTAKNPESYCKGHLRWSDKGSKKLFHAAIRKHGKENFSFEIIWIAFDRSALDRAEDYFIVEEFKTLAPFGYNLKGGGHNGKSSEELSAIMKAALASPEARRVKREAMIAVWQRPEHRQKIAATNSDPEVQQRKSTAMRLDHGRPEFREGARARGVRQFSDPAAREAARQTSIENFRDPEIAARYRAAFDDPDRRERLRSHNSGLRYVNNGVENRRIEPSDPVPDGWSYGMLVLVDRSLAQARGRHSRWHVARGVVDPRCALCTGA